jgi:4-aminobutyrate aminotransferase-like enzyme
MSKDNPFHSLSAWHFRNDDRVIQAKKLILDALKDHQLNLTAVRPPKTELMQSYQETLASFNQIRGGKLYYPYLGSGFGNGALVELLDGSVKYDMISGIGPHYWGHSHPEIMGALFDSILNDTVMQGHLQQNVEAYHYTKLLCDASGMDHCFLSSSGAMANENALKIIFQKKYPAQRLLAFAKCFMGRTTTLSQITDKPSFRENLPQTLSVDYIPFYNPLYPQQSLEHTLKALEKHIQRYPDQHAAMCLELIQGESGFHAGTQEYFQTLMAELKKNGIAILVDEVQTFGRTPELFAYQYYQLQEYVDVVTIGKLSQVCATLFQNDYQPRPGLLSQTFTGSTGAIYAGYYIVRQLLERNYFGPNGKIEHIHQAFTKHFQKLEERYPDRIQGPYGIGTMVAFTPFDGNSEMVSKFVQELFQAGVISFIAGSSPTRVRFLVPVGAITDNDIDQVMQIVEKVLNS